MRNKKTFQICLDALLLALLIIGSQIAIKLSYVTFTLQLLIIFIIAIICNLKHSMLILTCYIIMGLIGIPVFASWGGGFSYVLSPTFGFVYGFYIVILFLSLAKKINYKNFIQQMIGFSLFSLVSLVFLYIIGFTHGYIAFNLLRQKNLSLITLLQLFIVPYIPFDLLKIAVAILVSYKLQSYFDNYLSKLHFKSIDSTSSYLKRNYKSLDNLTFVSADFQSQGRGRLNRKWENVANKSLMFSVLIKDKELIDNFQSLSIATAVSIFKVLTKLNVNNVSIKWPNDIYVNNKKICGILLESISEKDQIECLVIGVGVNVNEEEFSDELKDKATSYFIENKKHLSIKKLQNKIYKSIKKSFKEIKENNKDYLTIANEYNYLKNKYVYGEYHGKRILVKVLQINQDNSLKVLLENNEEKNLFTGEITFHMA